MKTAVSRIRRSLRRYGKVGGSSGVSTHRGVPPFYAVRIEKSARISRLGASPGPTCRRLQWRRLAATTALDSRARLNDRGVAGRRRCRARDILFHTALPLAQRRFEFKLGMACRRPATVRGSNGNSFISQHLAATRLAVELKVMLAGRLPFGRVAFYLNLCGEAGPGGLGLWERVRELAPGDGRKNPPRRRRGWSPNAFMRVRAVTIAARLFHQNAEAAMHDGVMAHRGAGGTKGLNRLLFLFGETAGFAVNALALATWQEAWASTADSQLGVSLLGAFMTLESGRGCLRNPPSAGREVGWKVVQKMGGVHWRGGCSRGGSFRPCSLEGAGQKKTFRRHGSSCSSSSSSWSFRFLRSG